MADRISYKSLRDQLISISIDIEDKQKLCEALAKKIEVERQNLSNAETFVKEEYDAKLERLLENHNRQADDLKEKSQQQVAAKAEFVNRSKQLVEELQEIDREVATEVRSIYRQTESEIEIARKEFRSGYEERLQKYVASKAQEYKESTGKALQPEISRLQLMHEREMKDVEANLRAEERSCRQQAQQQLQRCCEQEREALQQELQLSKSALEEHAKNELEALLREHSFALQRLREENDRELSKHRAFLSERNEKQRQESHEELQRQQRNSSQRLLDAKQKHAQDIERLQQEHEQQLRLLRKRAESAQKKSDDLIRSNLKGTKSSAADRSKRKSATAVSGISNSGNNSSNNNSSGNSSGGLVDKGDEFNDSDGSNEQDRVQSAAAVEVAVTAEEELKIAAVRREAETARDRELQAEIRALETEALRQERKLRQQAEQQKSDIRTVHSKEQELLQKRSRRETEDAAQLAADKAAAQRALLTAQSNAAAAAAEETALRREVAVYRDGVAAQVARIADKKEQQRLQLREIQLIHGPTLRELQERKEQLQMEKTTQQQRHEDDVAAIKDSHQEELSHLNEQVRSEVLRRDEEIAQLRDAIEAENTKTSRLQNLIKRYSEGASKVTISKSISSGKSNSSSNRRRDAAEDTEADAKSAVSRSSRRLPENGRNIRAVRAGIPFSDTSRTATTTTINDSTTATAITSRGNSTRRNISSSSNSNSSGKGRDRVSGRAADSNRSGPFRDHNDDQEEDDDNQEEEVDESLLPAPPLLRRPYTPPAPPRRLAATASAAVATTAADGVDFDDDDDDDSYAHRDSLRRQRGSNGDVTRFNKTTGGVGTALRSSLLHRSADTNDSTTAATSAAAALKGTLSPNRKQMSVKSPAASPRKSIRL